MNTINPHTKRLNVPFGQYPVPINWLLNTATQLIDEGKEPVVVFSIYSLEEDCSLDDYTVRCPDILSTEPVIQGECIFSIDYWRVSPTPVQTKIYTNPTWKDIINACNDLLQQGDRCGVYFEGIEHVKKVDGVNFFEFLIGS